MACIDRAILNWISFCKLSADNKISRAILKSMEEIKFIKSIVSLKERPKLQLPEIILCGRSNVGKSSFINSLSSKKDVAKISSSPGKTRTINYYMVKEKFYIVDLPGFGYAKVSKTEREKWQKQILNFINNSSRIKLAFHIIDSRHKPTELDIALNLFLKSIDLPTIVLLNKSDKLKQSEIKKSLTDAIRVFPELSYGDNLFLYSAVKATGRKEVASLIINAFS